MQSSDWQSAHLPIFEHGVFFESRTAFGGAAIFLTLDIASSTFFTTLFIPTIRITFSGPWQRQATLFPVPSIFTSSPSIVTAFELIK